MDRVRDAHLEPDQDTLSSNGGEEWSGNHTYPRDRFMAMMGGAGAALVGGGAGSALAAHAGAHPALRSSAAPAAAQTLTLAVFQEPDTLDLGASGLITTSQICAHIFDPLVWRLPNAQGVIKTYPGLAQSVQVSPDATTYTFKLRKDVVFHDGTPFDAHAVKATFDHIVAPSTKSRGAAPALGPYKETRVIDKYTAAIVFSQPNAAFLEEMAATGMFISSPTALAKYGADYGHHPVGTGPFIFQSWTEGQSVVTTANPNYKWGPPPLGGGRPPLLKQLVFRILPDHAAQANALSTGEITIAQSLNPQDVANILQSGGFKKLAATSTGMPYCMMVNAKKAPTDDVRVRQALEYATNQDAIIKTLFFGLYTPATSIFTQITPGYDPSQHMYSYNPTKAGQLLDQAGWVKGSNGMRAKGGQPLKLNLINITGFGFDGIAQILQAQYQAMGIQTAISDQSFPAIAATYNRGDQHLADFFYYEVSPYLVRALFSCDQIASGFNWEHYCNPAVDKMVAQANAVGDNAKRYALYKQIGKQLMEAAVIIPIYDMRTVLVGPSSMSGIVFTANAIPLFHAASV